jgi:hypothetical protein
MMIVVKMKRDVILLYKMGVACGPHSGCLVGESGGDGLLGGH